MQITARAKVNPTASPTEIVQAILTSRGYDTPEAQQTFQSTPPLDLEYLYKESGLSRQTLASAQSLIDTHLQHGHDICIFGDYDADGVTATAVLYLALSAYAKQQQSQARLLPFIPDRHKHGYGLSKLALSEVLSGAAFNHSAYSDFRPSLIVTVDTGIVAHDSVLAMKAAGCDVLLTDHHLPTAALPAADVIVHTLTTSGAGVAWILAAHLLADPHPYLDLATIGIVADMMPLTGFNRTLVKHGLKALENTSNLGLNAMKTLMGTVSSQRALTTYDISFGIAPRINAAGRIYSPLDALRLLCTQDSALATNLAKNIESHNTDRQVLTDSALTDALTRIPKHKLIALAGDYHEGVIGLVAGKLVEKEFKPSVVISVNGDVCKGSARSVPGFDITNFLRSLKTPFLGLGGHEQAAGFSLSHDQLDNLLRELQVEADRLIDDTLLIRKESADLELDLSQATLELAKLLHALEPYGLGNPKPRFLFKNLQVLEDRALGEAGKHHKLIVERAGLTKELLMFNTKHAHPLHTLKSCIANLDTNIWKNRESLQLVAAYVES